MTQTSPFSLQMEGITKSFGPVKALQNVTFSLRPATIHALVGENGAGKSTLMKTLAGVHLPDSGRILVNGEPVVFREPADSLRAGIAMIHQELALAEDLSVMENIFLGVYPSRGFPGWVDFKKMENAARELIERFSFDLEPRALVSKLSTAECQAVEILKALARNSKILVLDEPTSSLSEKDASRVVDTLKNLRSKGLSIIYISHRLEEVKTLADDITVLRDGSVVHSSSAAGFTIEDIVRHMVGRPLSDYFPKRESRLGETSFRLENISTNKIREIDLEIKSGEVVGMAGLMGAGRTEVAEAIFGIDTLSTGKVYLNGKQVSIRSPQEAIRSGIAFLTEDRKRTGLCLELACSWNVTLPVLDRLGMASFINPDREEKIVTGNISRLHIKWKGPKAPASSLSGGNQQKLLIARWLLAEAKLVIFDEPTRGIDVGAKREVYEWLNLLAGEGKAILVISSELPELLGITDRILVMRHGALAGNLVTKNTNQEEIMRLAALDTPKVAT